MVQHSLIDHTGITGVGGGAPAAHAASHQNGGSDEIDVTGLVGAGGGGGAADDPVADIFGAADTAYEFDTSSLTGLTAIGSPTTEDAHTTVPGHLYYSDATAGTAFMGRYLASPATPFTVIVKVSDATIAANYNAAGVLVGVANPVSGAFVFNSLAAGSRNFQSEKFSNRTTYVSNLGSSVSNVEPPYYVACVVNSTTSIDYLYSHAGRIWKRYISANNPSLTVGSVGLAMKSENGGGLGVAFDFLRIWNSAKTFPGVA